MCLVYGVVGPLLRARYQFLVRKMGAQHTGQGALKTVFERLFNIFKSDLETCISIQWLTKKAGDVATFINSGIH